MSDALEVAAALGQQVAAAELLDQALPLEGPQPFGQQAARESGQAAGQAVERRRADVEVAQDQQRPAVPDEVEGAGDRAVLAVALGHASRMGPLPRPG